MADFSRKGMMMGMCMRRMDMILTRISDTFSR